MSIRWLIDKSALARAGKPEVARVLAPRIDGGRIAVSVVTELEVGFRPAPRAIMTTYLSCLIG
jgi:predicted nucleic acid-binding protein